MSNRTLAGFGLCLIVITNAIAADWPQFRGAQASGIETTKPVVTQWNVATGQNIRWQTPIPGLAHASPIIFGDRIFVATAVAPGQSELKVGLYGDIEPVDEGGVFQWRLLALEKSSGKVVWNTLGHQAVPRAKRHPKSSHCNSTPATDGKSIVTIFGSEGLFCFSAEGKLLWKKDFGPMDSGFFAVPSAQWGFASSPVIHEGKVIMLCDVQTNSFIAAFDLRTGRALWAMPRKDVPTWGTPTVVDSGSRTQIVVNGWHHSGGYDFNKGKALWRLDGGGDIPVPTPIFAHGLIFLTSAHGNLRPMRAIRPEATGNITAPDPAGTNSGIAWVHPRQGNYMQAPIAVGNWVFGCNDAGVLTCFDAKTGKINFSERLGIVQGYSASPVSDGRHLIFSGETGKIVVVPVSDKFSTVATNIMDDLCMATPAIADGTLYLRTQKKLVAIAAK